jgi:hypothetical protein
MDNFWEHVAEENIWTYEGRRNRRLQKVRCIIIFLLLLPLTDYALWPVLISEFILKLNLIDGPSQGRC